MGRIEDQRIRMNLKAHMILMDQGMTSPEAYRKVLSMKPAQKKKLIEENKAIADKTTFEKIN